MPIPFLIPVLMGTLVAGSTGVGIGAASDARKKNKEAQKIVNRSKEKWEEVKNSLEKEKLFLETKLEVFGKTKINIFDHLIGDFLRLVKDCSNNVSSTANIKRYISKNELKKLEKERLETLKIVSNGIEGAATGVATAGGIYSLVGIVGSASTGTAISSLGGAAATNATLAWFGGGSLAAGGGGIALGTTIVGGLIAGPAILVMGLRMDNQAEENLTKAKEFEAKVEKDIEIMKKSIEDFKIANIYVDEGILILNKLKQKYFMIKKSLLSIQEQMYQNLLRNRFNNTVVRPPLCQLEEFNLLIPIIQSIKNILEADVADDKGNFNTYFKKIINKERIVL